MKEQYSKIPENTFKQLGINAAMVLSDFDPATGTVADADIIGATTGGVNFNAAPEYTDWGEDIDNCPKNTKELKRISDWTVTMSGTFITMTPAMAEMLTAAADNTSGHIVPRDILDIEKDFRDVWLVGDYSEKNTGNGAGYIAIHIMNALSTGGFQIQTADKEKMQFSFEFTAHYSIDAQDEVPFEIYIKGGSAAPGISLNRSRAKVAEGATITLTANKYPTNATVTWDSTDDEVATVDGGEVEGVGAGYAVISASITDNGTTYTDICTVEVVENP